MIVVVVDLGLRSVWMSIVVIKVPNFFVKFVG